MDDLVKRLRNHIAVVIDNKGHAFESETLCEEAADLIEALEARVAAADKLVHEVTLMLSGEGSVAMDMDDALADYEVRIIASIEPAPVSVWEAALREIAAQKNSDELSRDEWDVADFTGGYDECINKARSALRAIAEEKE